MYLFISRKTILLDMKQTQSGVLIENGYSSGIRGPMLFPFSCRYYFILVSSGVALFFFENSIFIPLLRASCKKAQF